MSEEEYEAEIARRLAEDGMAVDQAPAANASVSETDTSAHEAIVNAQLAAMAKEAALPPKTLGGKIGELYEKGKKLFPEEVQDYVDEALLGSAGYLAGQALRANIDPKYRYGTPEYKAQQARLDSAGELRDIAFQSQEAMNEAKQRHADTTQAIQANADTLARQHAAAEQALQQAEQDHMFHSVRNPTEEAEAHLQGVERQLFGNDGSAGGNTGRANQTGYNTRTAQEAARNKTIFSTLESMGLNPTRAFAEAPDLASTQSGFAIPKDVAAELEAERRAKQDQMNQQRDAIAKRVAQEKAEAKLRLEQARTTEANARAALNQEMQRLQKHVASAPISDTARMAHQENIARSNALQAELPSRGQRAMEFFGKKILPKFVPGIGAALAPLEIEQAKKDYEAGNYLRAAAHGVGGIGGLAQATNIPWLMGAGDILQTPAAGLALYDFMQQPNSR